MSVINILMQLRKVCNHPNMFEPRPIVSPFRMEGLVYYTASCVYDICKYNPFKVSTVMTFAYCTCLLIPRNLYLIYVV